MAPSGLFTALMLAIRASAGLIQPQDFDLSKDPETESPLNPPVILSPLRSIRRGSTKRDRRSALELKSEEIFQWIGVDGTLAEFKVQMPGQNENIVNLELIDDLVQKVDCPASGTGDLRIRFAEAADFDDAGDIWNWVNQKPANHFLMVVGEGACGGNADRVVYDVSGLGYDDGAETAVLKVQETTWKEAAHTYDLTVGKVDGHAKQRLLRSRNRRGFLDSVTDAVSGAAGAVVDRVKDGVDTAVDAVKDVPDKVVDAVKEVPSKVVEAVKQVPSKVVEVVKEVPTKVIEVVKELPSQIPAQINDIINPGIAPDFSIPFDHSFSDKTLSFSANGLSVSANCKECFTTGSFDVRGRFRVEQLQMQEAWIELSTEGVSAKAVIGLGLKGNLTEKLAERTLTIFTFSPAGVSIPGVLVIGPTISVKMGVELSEITAGLNLALGGTATIPKSVSRLDFLSQAGSKSTGWKPEFKAEPFKADGFVEAKAVAFLRPAIGLEISVVDTGMVAEISANTPSLTAYLKAIRSSNCSACGDSENGLQGGLTLGASIGASLKKKVLGVEDALFSVTFAEAQLPIAGFCQGFGSKGDACLAN